jgi:hypothetical protein
MRLSHHDLASLFELIFSENRFPLFRIMLRDAGGFGSAQPLKGDAIMEL